VKKPVNLWEDEGESDLLPEINEQDNHEDESDLSLLYYAIDLNELQQGDETTEEFAKTEQVGAKQESADSVLAWGGLGMLLGSPAPISVSRKMKKMRVEDAQQLWDDGESNDAMPSIYPDEANDTMSSSGGSSTAQQWCTEQDALSDDDDDTHSIPCLSKISSVPCLSRISSVSGSTDDDNDECSSSSLNPSIESYDDLLSSPKRESDAADSVLAWSALAAFMGSPAHQAVSPKKKKEVKFLWGPEDSENECMPALADV